MAYLIGKMAEARYRAIFINRFAANDDGVLNRMTAEDLNALLDTEVGWEMVHKDIEKCIPSRIERAEEILEDEVSLEALTTQYEGFVYYWDGLMIHKYAHGTQLPYPKHFNANSNKEKEGFFKDLDFVVEKFFDFLDSTTASTKKVI